MPEISFNVEYALLYAVADDYEDLQTVLKAVTEWAFDDGVQLAPDVIRKGLIEAIRKGLIDAKTYSGGSYSTIPSVNATQLSACWFFPSRQGLELLKHLGPRRST